MKVDYIGACMDSSGYAEAARNNIAAIHQAGIDIAVNPVSFEGKKASQGKLGDLVQSLAKKKHDSDVQILHVTPQHYPNMVKKDKYNIGYAAWETSLLPKLWVGYVNTLDEIWVPSEHNVQCFKDSGVTIPVYCIPHAFNVEEQVDSSSVLENRDPDDFVFYSIFQWLERKNPIGLLRAYLTEFSPDEKVVLVLKTFLMNAGAPNETEMIRERIRTIKKTLYLDKYPRMLLIGGLLSREKIHSLHREGDCYTSLHRCEGFGIPIAEAMMAGNPVITTGYGGPADFVTPGKTGELVDYNLTPVAGMPWEMYKGWMDWAEPDLMHARKLMRRMFEDKKRANRIGKAASKWVSNNLSWEAVGNKIQERLEEIS